MITFKIQLLLTKLEKESSVTVEAKEEVILRTRYLTLNFIEIIAKYMDIPLRDEGKYTVTLPIPRVTHGGRKKSPQVKANIATMKVLFKNPILLSQSLPKITASNLIQ